MREPYLIPDAELSCQVTMCVTNDTQYGPIAMACHANIGSEYERLLIDIVKEHKLSYEGTKLAFHFKLWLQNVNYSLPSIWVPVPVPPPNSFYLL